MIWKALLVCTAVAMAQQPAPAPQVKPGSITISVVSDATGAPVPYATMMATTRSSSYGRLADAQGHATFPNMPPGKFTVSGVAPGGLVVTKSVELASEQDLSVQIRVPIDGQISGRVLDQNNDPLPNIAVYLVTREYSLGNLRYVYAATTKTNDKGEYLLEHAHPGFSYLLLAAKEQNRLEAISSAPADAKFRRAAFVPTYYPDVTSPEGAPVLKVGDNQRRDNMDIRLARSANYCIEGMVPGGARFELREKWPVNVFLVGRSTSGVAVPSGVAGSDGRIRVCDVHSGEYELAAYTAPAAGDVPGAFSRTSVAIGDHDLDGVALRPAPHVSVPGEIVWDGPPPATPVTAKLQVIVSPLARAFGRGLATMVGIPGPFPLDLLMDDDNLDFGTLPAGVYVKDVEYGGRSIFHQVFRPGTAAGEAGLRVMLGADGGTIAFKVADKDGNPIPDLRVVVIPKKAGSEAVLAATMVSGQADPNGSWTTPTLAPGSYYAIATTARVDMSPEFIAQLWRARDRAAVVDVGVKGSAQVTLVPVVIE